MALAEVPYDLVEVKLAAPLPRPGTVAKADVIGRLCASSLPFVTVVAPAGYGKTTLLRSYFLGVSIIAAFNAVVIGLAAWVVGVPLAGTIAVVTFVSAYVPYVGAWVAAGFAVMIALGTEGTEAALIMAVVSLLGNTVLQQLIQPFVMGATLSLNPLVVLVVTIGAGALFGMVGLTLAAPLTSAAVHIANELQAQRDGSGDGAPAPAPAPSG